MREDPRDYNDRYTDHWPLVADDFADWPASNLSRISEVYRDRENHRLFDVVMGNLASMTPPARGHYFEFGVCGAGQFRLALSKARKWHVEGLEFWAFDSFEGLPTDGSMAMSEDAFWLSVRGAGVNVDKVKTVRGFYRDTLTDALQKQFVDQGLPIEIVNIDCDLHESAVDVFRFIAPLLRPGSLIYVDDYWSTLRWGRLWGTARAFAEFAAKHATLKFHPFVRSGWWGQAYMAYDPADFPAPLI